MAIVTIGGDPGSGKSTLARRLAAALHVPHYSMGDLYRDLAKEQGIPLPEFAKRAEQDPAFWDKRADAHQAELARKERSFVIDSRLGFHFIPQSIKIFLTVDREEAARRVARQQRTEEHARSVEDVERLLKERQASEQRRYQEFYGIDYRDHAHYDLIVDTTRKTEDAIFDEVLAFVKRHV